MTIFYSLLALGFLIFIHELGHFLFARKVGVAVEEFAIGFPPRILKKIIGKTQYTLGLIPVGGFVKMSGQNIDDENPNQPGNYASKSIFQRFQIIIGGPLANLIFALLFMPLVFMFGQTYPAFYDSPAHIDSIVAGSPAEMRGIEKGDTIVQINDRRIAHWNDANRAIGEAFSGRADALIIVKRNQNTIQINIPIEELKTGVGWNAFIPPIIGRVLPGKPAELAGLRSGDAMKKINGKPVATWSESTAEIKKSGERVTIEYQRGNKIRTVTLPLVTETKTGGKLIGIGIPEATKQYSFVDAVIMGTEKNAQLIVETLTFIKSLFTAQVNTDNLGGPVMITKIIGSTIERSATDFIFLLCFISIQLAILNLLPFPVLDGGHLLFLLIEKIKGSPLSVKFRQMSQTVGFVVLVSFMIYITTKDITTLFSR